MTLINDWKEIIRKAWSIRLILLAGMFSGLEVIIPYVPELFPQLPRGLFALLSLAATGGAFVTRILAQKNMKAD